MTIPPSNEGRYINPEGMDEKDLVYHSKGWATTPEADKAQLEELRAHDAELRAANAIQLLRESPEVGKRLLTELVSEYPDHPDRATWETYLT